MSGSWKSLGVTVAILALVAIASFTPRLRLPHDSPRWNPNQQTSLHNSHRFVDDASADQEITACPEFPTSTFVPIALNLTLQTLHSNSLSRYPAFQESQLSWPLRRLPSSSDNEEPQI